ncbi:cytochrome b5 [Hysterangium stoloniferum]|nr:cytochrome b5 [Hysterangium stoloniferum]
MSTTTTSSAKEVTYEQLKQHTSKGDLYLLVHNKVYDVAKFIDEHPGGDEVMLAEAGKDATEAFEDVGHSDEAREKLAELFVGNFEKGSVCPIPTTALFTIVTYFIPLAFLGAYFAWRYYLS